MNFRVPVLGFVVCLAASEAIADLRKIPDRLVVLTFDDGNISDVETVAPVLKNHGFGATFFITSGWLNRERRMTWPDVVRLQDAGFEIGCHTSGHPNLIPLSTEQIREEIANFDRECAKHGVKKATTFSYPGGHFDRRMLSVLTELGYTAARRGRDPEFPLDDAGGTGRAYFPGEDDPFLIPSTMTRGIGALEDKQIIDALAMAKDGAVTVLTSMACPTRTPTVQPQSSASARTCSISKIPAPQ